MVAYYIAEIYGLQINRCDFLDDIVRCIEDKHSIARTCHVACVESAHEMTRKVVFVRFNDHSALAE